MNVPHQHLLILAGVLFGLGCLGFLLRRNAIIVLASVELMLNAANLAFVTGCRIHSVAGRPSLEGPIFTLFVILIAAAEAAIGLALVIALYRLKQTAELDTSSELRG